MAGAGTPGRERSGLPNGIRGCLFDLDGVLTKTVQVHDAAWKEMFDIYLGERTRQMGWPFGRSTRRGLRRVRGREASRPALSGVQM